PTVGDGRQSGTSESPSILNASPEAAVGGGLALLQTGDRVRLDIPNRRLDMLVSADEITRRRAAHIPLEITNNTPWEELYRTHVGQLGDGGCLEFATHYQRTAETLPRDNH
ncbi:MAG: dihydroxy-acid dehydratase, partial [Pseudomonadota bacterium]